ncbi:hypothetical protein LINPERHAP2_LOCUS15118 [Linum perenne]
MVRLSPNPFHRSGASYLGVCLAHHHQTVH